MKFKAGDKVRVIGSCGTLKKGSIHIVKKTELGLNIGPKNNIRCFHDTDNHWELVKQEKVKFKVGIRVKVLKSTYGVKKPYFGTVDSITRLGDIEIKGIKARYFDEDYAYFHNLDTCEVELAEKTLYNLEAGDVVFDKRGDKMTVSNKKAYLMKYPDGGEFAWSPQELKDYGWKLKDDDKVEEAMKLLKDKGYKIVKR